MLTSEQISHLKKCVASVDFEKAKKRIIKDYKSTTKQEKEKILSLSGLAPNSFYNVAKTGTASPRVVISLAQILNVSPLYYTGESDDKAEFTNKIAKEFYEKYRNDKSSAKKREKNIKSFKDAKPIEPEMISNSNELEETEELLPVNNVSEKQEIISVKSTETFSVEFENSEKMNKAILELSEESAIILLKALLKREDTSENAKMLAGLVKRCLLS